jgi:hypothetical protein
MIWRQPTYCRDKTFCLLFLKLANDDVPSFGIMSSHRLFLPARFYEIRPYAIILDDSSVR